MSGLWWLSFCDPDRPRGSQFLGACIVQGRDMADACKNAWANRCNPGGEALGFAIPPLLVRTVPPHRIGVLLDKFDCLSLEGEIPGSTGP